MSLSCTDVVVLQKASQHHHGNVRKKFLLAHFLDVPTSSRIWAGWKMDFFIWEICRRDQPDQRIVQPMSQACPETCPFAAEMEDPSKFLGEFLVREGYGNQNIWDADFTVSAHIYGGVYRARNIFSQLVNLHWWDSGKNASFFFRCLALLLVFFWHFWQIRWLGAQNQRMRGYCPSICLQQVLPVQVCEGSGPWKMLQLFS